MTEFLPCPHCGSDDIAPIAFKGCNGDVWDEFVACGGCGATAETVEAWNSRAERTCEMRADGAHCMNGVEFYECRSCGEYACIPTAIGKSEPPNYCPNCGAKVVGE